MEVKFIGCGDAFGSGGRFNTCFLLTGTGCRFLVDCGASSLVALKHHGIEPNTIDAIVVSHLHGDHFGGLPFFLLDAGMMSKRDRPLAILGPPGLPERLKATQEVLFPGSSERTYRFPVAVTEMTLDQRHEGHGFAVTPRLAAHSSGAPSFNLCIECDGRVVTYSGDTAWTETLVPAAQGADLFICECSYYDRAVAGHLDYASLKPRLGEIGAKRVILTHMDPVMLARRADIAEETATDGLVVTL